MATSDSSSSRSGIAAAFGCYLCWGLFPLYWIPLQQVPAMQILGHRMVWSALLIVGILAWRRHWQWLLPVWRQPRQLGVFALSASLLACNWLTFIWAVNNGHVIEASLGYFVNPLVNILLGRMVLGERLNRIQLAAISVSVAGVAWLTFMGHEKKIDGEQQQWKAIHDEDLGNGLTWLKPSKANNTYALTMGPGVANECIESKDGPVIWEDHFYPEIIDPNTGEVLPEGSQGELVFTSLSKEALPVVRYRTRDLTRLLAPTSRSFRRIGKITGRSDDMLIVRGVNVFPTQIEEQIMRDPRLTGNYQIVLSRDGHLDNVEVRCEVQRELSGKLSRAAVEEISRGLQHHIKTIIGISTRIKVMDFDTIPRTQTGKARRVIDERPKQL